MPAELRGLALAWSLLAAIMGVLLCAFEESPGVADLVTIAFILFFFICGVVLRCREGLHWGHLVIASALPPVCAIAYIIVAVRRLGCTALTGGVAPPSPGYLAELVIYGIILVWMGIGSSLIIRRAADFWDSPRFLNLLKRQARRVEAIGVFVDKVSGLSKIANLFKGLTKGG
jgi:ABC-type multidrug transport system permease subunit